MRRGRAAANPPLPATCPRSSVPGGQGTGLGEEWEVQKCPKQKLRRDQMERSGGKSGASCSRQGQGLGSCWESKPRDINTSKGRASASASAVSRAPPVPQPPQHLGLQSPPKPGKAPVAGSTSPCAQQLLPCPDFPRRDVSGCSQAKHGAFPSPCPTAQKWGGGRPAHVPVAKTLRMSQPLGCWGVPLSLTSLGLTERNKKKKHK